MNDRVLAIKSNLHRKTTPKLQSQKTNLGNQKTKKSKELHSYGGFPH